MPKTLFTPKQKRLDTIVRELKIKHVENILPFERGIHINIDEKFNGEGDKRSATMARFYETLTRGFYGGELNQRVVLDEEAIRLDVYDKEKETAYECKATRSGKYSNLSDVQITKYKKLQLHLENLNLYFAFYRHSIRNIQSTWEGTPEELIDELRSSEQYSLVLPLSMILALHNHDKGSKFTTRYERPYPHEGGTSIMTSAFGIIAMHPENFITDLGLDLDNYLIGRYKSPAGVRIIGTRESYKFNEGKLHPIPIIKIDEKPGYHKSWVKQLMEEHLEGVPF